MDNRRKLTKPKKEDSSIKLLQIEKDLDKDIRNENYAAIVSYFNRSKNKFFEISTLELDLSSLESYNNDLIFIAQSFRIQAYAEQDKAHAYLDQAAALYKQAMENIRGIKSRFVSDEIGSQSMLLTYCLASMAYHHSAVDYNVILEKVEKKQQSQISSQELEKIKTNFEDFLKLLKTQYKNAKLRDDLGITQEFELQLKKDIKNMDKLLDSLKSSKKHAREESIGSTANVVSHLTKTQASSKKKIKAMETISDENELERKEATDSNKSPIAPEQTKEPKLEEPKLEEPKENEFKMVFKSKWTYKQAKLSDQFQKNQPVLQEQEKTPEVNMGLNSSR